VYDVGDELFRGFEPAEAIALPLLTAKTAMTAIAEARARNLDGNIRTLPR
jgi:hypothetical protein